MALPISNLPYLEVLFEMPPHVSTRVHPTCYVHMYARAILYPFYRKHSVAHHQSRQKCPPVTGAKSAAHAICHCTEEAARQGGRGGDGWRVRSALATGGSGRVMMQKNVRVRQHCGGEAPAGRVVINQVAPRLDRGPWPPSARRLQGARREVPCTKWLDYTEKAQRRADLPLSEQRTNSARSSNKAPCTPSRRPLQMPSGCTRGGRHHERQRRPLWDSARRNAQRVPVVWPVGHLMRTITCDAPSRADDDHFECPVRLPAEYDLMGSTPCGASSACG